MKRVKVGDLVRFNPFHGIHIVGLSSSPHVDRIGQVVEVHEKHGWFAVKYILGGTWQRVSFNFPDIGRNVFVVR